MIVAEKGSKGRPRQWKLVDAEPVETEDKQQRKQRLHREEMVQFRLRKKLRESSLRTEHAQLERQMERCLAALKQAAAKNRENTDQKEVTEFQQNLVLQAEALRFQNQKLQKVVTDYDKLQRVIHAEGERVVKADNSQSVLGGSGWLVTFPNNQPPFHFHPFSKKEIVEIVQNYDRTMAIGASDFIEVGTLLGWKVDRLPLALHPNGRWMLTRVKFSKQIRCAAGESEATMEALEAASWPVLTAPELCPCVHRATSTSLKLQEIDKDTVVIVSDTPKQSRGMNLRYLTLMHRRHSVDNQGRRCITYVMAIPDSKANKRNREAEQSRDQVLWVCEGAAYMTLKQIDNSTLEVAYDNSNGCKNEFHAQQLLIEWAHEAIRWEQLVTPSRLLAM